MSASRKNRGQPPPRQSPRLDGVREMWAYMDGWMHSGSVLVGWDSSDGHWEKKPIMYEWVADFICDAMECCYGQPDFVTVDMLT